MQLFESLFFFKNIHTPHLRSKLAAFDRLLCLLAV